MRYYVGSFPQEDGEPAAVWLTEDGQCHAIFRESLEHTKAFLQHLRGNEDFLAEIAPTHQKDYYTLIENPEKDQFFMHMLDLNEQRYQNKQYEKDELNEWD